MSLEDFDFILGPLKLKIDGYHFPDTTDYWDANWLLVTAEIDSPGQAWVRATGPLIMTAELGRFRDETKRMYEKLDGQAELKTLEPELKITLSYKNSGAIIAEIELTPDHMTQDHRFIVGLDQSYLPQIISQIASILERFPVRYQPE